MVKVSITLPNSAQITLESEEPEVIHQIIGMVLRDLPKDLSQANPAPETVASRVEVPFEEADKGSSVDIDPSAVKQGATGHPNQGDTPVYDAPGLSTGPAAATPAPARGRSQRRPAPRVIHATATPPEASTSASSNAITEAPTNPANSPQRVQPFVHSPEAVSSFTEFCSSANPMGDMRKVVVAAEAAQRFLGMDSVDVTDLAGLFDLAGWRQAHNFIQTLRNAARDNYRWLERLPGRTGRYSVSHLGRSIILRN